MGLESYVGSGQELRRCGACAAVYLAPDFTDEGQAGFYAGRYRRLFPSETPWFGQKRFFAWRGDMEIARLRLARLAPLLPRGGCIFEVGSGFGAFLAAAAEAGATDLHASEPDLASRRRLVGGAPVTFHEGVEALPKASCNLVVAFHVLEHMTDPRRWLTTAFDALKCGGFTVLEVPDLFGAPLSASYVHPAHLSYFTSDTLRRLAEAVGFRIRFCGPHPDGGILRENLWVELEKPSMVCEASPVRKAPEAEIDRVDAWLGTVEWSSRPMRSWRSRMRALAVRLVGPGAVGEWQRWRQRQRRRRTPWTTDHVVR